MTAHRIGAVAFAILIMRGVAGAGEMPAPRPDLPEVASRTYAQNYRDLALASCIAKAYSDQPGAAADAGATAAGLESTWTNYDLDKSNGSLAKLVNKYLERQYTSINGTEIRLDLLKCLDLYHSRDLDQQVKRLVIRPDHTYRQDNQK